MNPLRVAIVQVSAGPSVDANLARLAGLLSGLPAVDVIALPEVFAFRATEARYRECAEPLDGPLVRRVAALARERGAWLLAGSVIEQSGGCAYNTCVVLDRAGRQQAAYRKIHLFEAFLDDGRHIREADAYESGNTPVLVDIEGWKAGLSICYDVRFPELFRHYADRGAHLLFVPSNFTQRTGQDHWETLVRARAIENQCFVVAPNQCGTNAETGLASHGHSMIVGPWGEILGCAGDEPAVLTAELDPRHLDETRRRIPALRHRVLGNTVGPQPTAP